MSNPSAVAPASPLYLALCGFAVGIANMVPGVSGGTMAFVLGIYERLIGALSRIDTRAIGLAFRFRIAELWRYVDATFLLLIAAGVIAAVVVFTKVINLPGLLISHPEPVYALFFGLVAASVAVLLRELPGFTARDALVLLAGVAAGLVMSNMVPVATPNAWWFVAFCGFIAISTMLLPGISGSFLLLMLGKYAYIFNAVGELNLTVIVPFVAGLAAGMVTFARVFRWLLAHHERATLVFICGLLVGSLYKLWPFQDRSYELVRDKQRLVASSPTLPEIGPELWLPLVLVLLGAAAVFAVSALAERRA